MKELSLLFLGLLLCASITGCGDGDGEEGPDCAPEDWVGTYELASDAECEYAPMATIVFNDEIVMELGSSNSTINWDGFEEMLTGCTTSDGILTLTLNGDVITSTIEECNATYNRK